MVPVAHSHKTLTPPVSVSVIGLTATDPPSRLAVAVPPHERVCAPGSVASVAVFWMRVPADTVKVVLPFEIANV